MNFFQYFNSFWAETELGPRAQRALCLPQPGHIVELAWVVRPTTGLVSRMTRPASACSERVSWHVSRWFTGGYPTTKLHTDVDPSDGASPGMAWPEAEAVDRPRRGPYDTQHVAWRCQRRSMTGRPAGRCPREASMDLSAPT
jgi:hypothetical protein